MGLSVAVCAAAKTTCNTPSYPLFTTPMNNLLFTGHRWENRNFPGNLSQ